MEDKNEYFTVRSSVYVRHLLSVWLGKKWWIFVFPILIFGILGIKDSRWIIVALMFLMIIIPGILALVYFNFALSPELAARTLPMKLSTSPSGITVVYRTHEQSNFKPAPESILYSDISCIYGEGKYLIISMASSPYSIIIIPANIPEATAIMQSWHNFC